MIHFFKKISKSTHQKTSTTIPQFNFSAIGDLKFELSNTPVVSIIIPFYNEFNITLNCLASLQTYLSKKYPYEIILVDDNSSESTDLSIIEGIQIIRNTENLGFLKNINLGIEKAKGEFIYILNNDTMVKEGFLDALFEVFENFENVGAVGSKLINLDGSLQEAGAVFLKNSKVRQIVKNKTVDSPEVNYIYEVDYCSGASLLFRKYQDDGSLNLLDEAFLPAYFEETNLCFDIKHRQGKKLMYTPFSEVIHIDGASYKKKDNSRKKILLTQNQEKFRVKWKTVLEGIQSETVEERILEKKQKSVVFYAKYIPQYDKGSGANRFNEIVKTLLKNDYHVSLLVKKATADNTYVQYYQKLGVLVYTNEGDNFNNFIRKQLATADISWFYGPNAFKSHYQTVKRLCKNTKVIYDMIDIHHLRFQRTFEMNPNDIASKKRINKYKTLEVNAVKKADITLAISDLEKEYMDNLVDGNQNIQVLSNIHSMKISPEEIAPFETRKDILFIGSNHSPNIDAVYYLYEEIMPKVWMQEPDLKVNIIGNIKDSINGINDSRIVFHGYVKNVAPLFNNSKMMVVPLRVGAGVKGKVGQAFEYGLPVVTTSIGAEGMFLENKKDALIADESYQFAEAIIKLNTETLLWKKLSTASDKVIKKFGNDQVLTIVEK